MGAGDLAGVAVCAARVGVLLRRSILAGVVGFGVS